MRVLVGCEFSGIVRDAFRAAGHDAVSCDLIDSEWPGPHIKGDVRDVLGHGWDLAIFHPPCKYLAVSGARHMWARQRGMKEALAFVRCLLNAPIPRIAVENPVSVIATAIRPPDQIIRPWWFGDTETKGICLWLKGLPPLRPTAVVPRGLRTTGIHHMAPSATRSKDRSKFFHGVARAMADQWRESVYT